MQILKRNPESSAFLKERPGSNEKSLPFLCCCRPIDSRRVLLTVTPGPSAEINTEKQHNRTELLDKARNE
ncbi:hypothetical protein L596_000958 [Steinernema carpocapsae]|uniref:Uncharacterized protein n=1 Tax=Steinernema carpocapsae TaxID=34508 RepID=A0A4U8UKD3_STECR|nr:hypothetical protein L596_000958 [Steinernema carpocapsae]